MPNGDVLHPFAPGSVEWDELWLEQDNGRALREFNVFHRDKEHSAADKAAVNEICVFFMKMKANARSYQQQVEWANPPSQVKRVLDSAARPLRIPPPLLAREANNNGVPLRVPFAACPSRSLDLLPNGTPKLTPLGFGKTTKRERLRLIPGCSPDFSKRRR